MVHELYHKYQFRDIPKISESTCILTLDLGGHYEFEPNVTEIYKHPEVLNIFKNKNIETVPYILSFSVYGFYLFCLFKFMKYIKKEQIEQTNQNETQNNIPQFT